MTCFLSRHPILSQTVPVSADALPSYEAASLDGPPRYASEPALGLPAPTYQPPGASFTAGPALETGLRRPSADPLAPLILQRPGQTLSRSVGHACAATVLSSMAGVSLILPAAPGIIMVAVGHERHKAAVQWAGVAWLGCIALYILHASTMRAQHTL